MKSKLYYVIPFVAIPVILYLLELILNMISTNFKAWIAYTVLAICCVVISVLSKTIRKFDWGISIANLLVFAFSMFLANFVDNGETYSRYDIAHALKVIVRPEFIIIYVGIFILPIIASYKKFRLIRER